MPINYFLGNYKNIVEKAWEQTRQDNITQRIWSKDYTLWKSSPDETINRLGWLDAPRETSQKIDYIRETIAPLVNKKIQHVILLGMGGSSLAAKVFAKIFGTSNDYPQLKVLDTTDPATIFQAVQTLDWNKTVFVVSSKSGTTLEIISLFRFFYNMALKKTGGDAGKHFILITDEGSPLMETAQNISPFHIFLNNSDIGGRYSALSFPGIVPATIIGVNVETLLNNAKSVALESEHIGTFLGAAIGELARHGLDKLTINLMPHWKSFGDWLEQLIAESTGKEGKGILPVLGESFVDVAAYGKDRVFVFFQNETEKNSSRIKELTKAGHPVITVQINDDYNLGSQMFIWEMATAVASYSLGINPFDQPDVEATKNHTRRTIAGYKENTEILQQKPNLATDQVDIYGDIRGESAVEILSNFLKQKTTGNYVCLQIYLSETPEIKEIITKLRTAIFKKYALPVTFGYGPRYLHSTGQLHKGGANNGLFIQLTAEDYTNLPIPDAFGTDDSSLSFSKLKSAQALGDWQALTEKNRRIIRIHCRKNIAALLNSLSDNQ